MPIGRTVIAAFAWAFVWCATAIALSLKLASELFPDAVYSPLFVVFLVARGVAWLMPGFVAGVVFVLAEAWWRGDQTRESSVAGWRALLIGAFVGSVVNLGASAWFDGLRWSESVDPSTLAFGLLLGASCGLATFLVERLFARRAQRVRMGKR